MDHTTGATVRIKPSSTVRLSGTDKLFYFLVDAFLVILFFIIAIPL